MKKAILAFALLFLAALSISWDASEKVFQFQFNGRWMPAVNPVHVGPNNYSVLKNLRYTSTSLETVDGYSNITSTPIPIPVNGFQFRKDTESHVLSKVNSSGTYYLYENETAVPDTGEFSTSPLYTVGDGNGYFSSGPQGTMFYVDDENALIWGGDELRVAGFLVSNSSTASTSSDYTENVSNDLTTEYANLGSGGDDSLAVLLLHFDGVDAGTAFTDSGATTHTVTATDDAQTDTDMSKFGTASGKFDGSGDYLSIPDHGDFYMGSMNFTVDFNFYATSSAGDNVPVTLYRQYDDATHYVHIYAMRYYSGSGSIRYERVYAAIADGTSTLTLCTTKIPSSWNHVALMRDSAEWSLTCSSQTLQSTDTKDSYITWPNLTSDVTIGGSASTADLTGWIDEFRVSKGVARWPDGVVIPTAAYFGGARYFFVASPLMLDSIKMYVSQPNTSSVTLAGAHWTGASYAALDLTDGTAVGAVSLAQTGEISWEFNEDAKPLYFNGAVLYVYRFDFNGGNAGAYKVTASAPLQPIKDLWNASGRTLTAFQAARGSTVAYEDYTFRVSEESDDTAEYAATIGGLTGTGSSDYIMIMSDDRLMGIEITMLAKKTNGDVGQVSDVQYFDGSGFVSVGTFTDTTVGTGGKGFNKSGSITWNHPGYDAEHQAELYGKNGYAYKLTISGTLQDGTDHDGTSVDLVKGIAAPLRMTGYSMVGNYNGRVMLVDKNRVDYSQTDTPWVFNGVDSSWDGRLSLYFGDQNSITAVGTLYNRYGSNIIDTFVICKKNETYALGGSQAYLQYNDAFVRKTVSTNIGCPAPLTMRQVNISVGDGDGLSRNALMWLDAAGPVLFEGTVPIILPGVENYFDPSSDECINYEYISAATAYVDTINGEYNLLFPTGDSTTNNKWIVFSFSQKKWYEKVPSAYPVVTFPVKDSSGGVYNYGHLPSGITVRLDSGSTWSGTAIDQEVRTGEFSPPAADEFGLWTHSELDSIKLISEAITEDSDVTISVYGDGSLQARTLTVPLDSGGAVSRNKESARAMSLSNYLYQIKFAATTSVSKWEPLAWGYKAKMIRED